MADQLTAAHLSAAVLRGLHRPGNPLVLPNVWDAASARTIEGAGFPVVATSSAGVAQALGYSDGEAAPVDEIFAALGRIIRAVAVPVTVDVERGYGLPVAELVGRLAQIGAAGCNLEDSDPRTGELVDTGDQARFLSAVRQAAVDAGIDLVLNARIDTYLICAAAPRECLADAIRRAHLYVEAGADCVYPILARTPQAIGALVRQIDAPLNVLFQSDGPSLAQLSELGVARVSFGPGLHRALEAHLARLVQAIEAGDDPYRQPYPDG